MDKKYLEEHNLMNAVKRLKQINEYVMTIGTNEADDMSDQQQNGGQDMGQQMPQQGGQHQQAPMGVGQQPDMNNGVDMGGADASMGGGAPMDAQGGMDMPMDGAQDDAVLDSVGSEVPDGGEGEESFEGVDDIEAEGNGDEVIDVDDLTQSQETAEYKIDGVDDKLTQLLDIVGKFEQAIEDNDAKIEDLKSELERRNPTQQEKLNIRSMNGSPYNVKPEDYWEQQAQNNPNYNIIANNDVDPDKEDDLYTITDDDLKNFNKSEIEKSISDYPKDLKGYF